MKLTKFLHSATFFVFYATAAQATPAAQGVVVRFLGIEGPCDAQSTAAFQLTLVGDRYAVLVSAEDTIDKKAETASGYDTEMLTVQAVDLPESSRILTKDGLIVRVPFTALSGFSHHVFRVRYVTEQADLFPESIGTRDLVWEAQGDAFILNSADCSIPLEELEYDVLTANFVDSMEMRDGKAARSSARLGVALETTNHLPFESDRSPAMTLFVPDPKDLALYNDDPPTPEQPTQGGQ